MARRTSTSGTCAFCGATVTKQNAARHVASCPEHGAAMQRAGRSRREPEALFHLAVQDAHGGQFWLQVEMRGSATLRQLDEYLRAIWLECCGHMSQFSIGGWRGDAIPMSKRASSVFQAGLTLTHLYDFGTESETRIKVVGARVGAPMTARPITLLARNLMPAAACTECGAPATFLCTECVTEHETWGVLCAEHAQTHPHDDYGAPIGLVNSPRMGLCGYTGPAKAPY